jgi:serine/threonine-protein kinase HipA
MTPLYDVLSAWPIIGSGANQLALPRARLAMALPGRRRHYRLQEIQPRHWLDLARRAGARQAWGRMLEMAGSVDSALLRVEKTLPARFPERVFATISAGMRRQANYLIEAARDLSDA